VVSKDGKRYFRTARHRTDIMAYGRTSKAGEHLKGGGEGLANWKACMSAIGMLMSDSARSQVAHLVNEYDGDPYYAGDDGGSRSGKQRLLDAVELACEVAGSSTASSRGTEFHSLAESRNKGKQPRVIQPHLADHLAHYAERVAPLTFLAQEIHVICDDLRRAGSIDYLLRLPPSVAAPDGESNPNGLVVCADLKTGRWDIEYPAGVSAQLAGYGLGCRYDQENNIRTPLHEDISRKWGVVLHYPIAIPGAEVRFYFVDLEVGKEAALLNNRLDKMIAFYRSQAGKPKEFTLGQ
jgi:hypothetical protein